MTPANQPTRNHTVNKSHLARFAREERIHRVPLDGVGLPIPVSLNDASVRKGFYVPEDPDGNREYAFEGWASQFEGAATSAVKHILDDGAWPPSAEERLALAEWIALQEIRTPTKRAYGSQIANVLITQLQEDGALDRLERRMSDLGWRFSDAERAMLRDELDQYSAAARVTTGMHLQFIKVGMAATVPMLMQRGWVLVRFDEQSLFTSDNPVVMAGENFSPSWLPLGLSDAAYVAVAIDRKAALVLPLDSGDGELDGEPEMASAINLSTLWGADEVLFLHPDDDQAAILPEVPLQRPRPAIPIEDFKDFSEWPVDTLMGFISTARNTNPRDAGAEC